MMNYEEAKRRFEEQIPRMLEENPEFASRVGGACYSTSEIAREIFKEFGIESEVLFVSGIIENEKAREIIDRVGVDNPQRLKQILIEEDGWTMGVGIGRDEKGMPNFHSVLYFPEEKEILDLTIKQLDRPERGIEMPDWYFGHVNDYMDMFSDHYGKELFRAEDFLKVFCPMVEREPERADGIKSTIVERMRKE